MLVGDQQPSSFAARLLSFILVRAFLTPWILMGAGSTLVGLLALGPRRADLGELWIGLPAGLALLLVVGVFLYSYMWRVPRLTITHFEFDGATLTCVTRRDGTVTHPAAELRSVLEERGRRGRGLLGWWLKFQHSRWLYLSRDTSNAEELVREIGRHAGYLRMGPPSLTP
jgi:hypothetical protein